MLSLVRREFGKPLGLEYPPRLVDRQSGKGEGLTEAN